MRNVGCRAATGATNAWAFGLLGSSATAQWSNSFVYQGGYTTSETQAEVNGPSFALVRGYDTQGRQNALSLYRNGTLVQQWAIGYDTAGRMSSTATARVSATLGYHPTAGLNSVTMGTGWVQSRTFDALDRLTGLQQGTLNETHGYDTAGRVSAVVSGTVNWAYGYDSQSQLTSAVTTGYSRTGTYDNLGNFLTLNINGNASNSINGRG